MDLLLWTTRTVPGIALRDYTPEQISGFLNDDQLDNESMDVATRFLRAADKTNADSAVSS